jgi:hypothetical protein
MRADGTPAPPLDTWWEGFGDLELTRIVQRALDQNLDLAASVARVEQARAAAKEAGAKLKPSGALNAQSTSFRQSLESPVGRLAGTLPGFDRNQSYLDLGVSAPHGRLTSSADLGTERRLHPKKFRQQRRSPSGLGSQSSARLPTHTCRLEVLRGA